MIHKQLNSWLRTHGHARGFVPPLPEIMGQYLHSGTGRVFPPKGGKGALVVYWWGCGQ